MVRNTFLIPPGNRAGSILPIDGQSDKIPASNRFDDFLRTSQPLAAQAGLGILAEGGNAIDAAIATAAALTVVEPCSNGIGSDAFALVWGEDSLHGLNGSGRWPAGNDAAELRADGHRSMPKRGWTPVTVPGAVDTWSVLHERFGHLPIERILAPAIRYAENGFPVSPVVARQWDPAFEFFPNQGLPELEGWSTVFAPEGRFSVRVRLREEGRAAFYSRETRDQPDARLRFTFP